MLISKLPLFLKNMECLREASAPFGRITRIKGVFKRGASPSSINTFPLSLRRRGGLRG